MCNGSGDHAEFGTAGCRWGCEGDGAVAEAESGGLGLPRMADKMEYSKFAASEPNAKFGSKETLKSGSFVGNGSAAGVSMAI